MSSFNVSCMLSSLSIEYRDSVYFIPLLKKNTKSKIGTFLGNPTELYTPFSLPILGEYNDYGAVINIEENENTKILENFFEAPIGEIIKMISENKPFFNPHSSLFNFYAKDKKIYSLKKEDPEIMLLRLGFKQIPPTSFLSNGIDKAFSIKDFPFLVVYNKNKEKYSIYDSSCCLIKDCDTYFNNIESLICEFYNLTGYALNIEDKHQNLIRLYNNLSGGFVLEDVYNNISDIMCETNKYKSINFNGNGLFEPKEILFEENDTIYEKEYEHFYQCVQYYNNKLIENRILKGHDSVAKEEAEVNEVFFEIYNPYGRITYFSILKDINDFDELNDIYLDVISKGLLKSDISKYRAFLDGLLVLNKTLVPGLSGLQDANYEIMREFNKNVSKIALEKLC